MSTSVKSPYAGVKISVAEHIRLASYWFATNFHWGAILLILLPGDVKAMVPDNRATVLGWVTAIGAIPALVVPLLSGALSDRCTSPLGRRRPFITQGIWINVVGLALMALCVTLHKMIPGALWIYTTAYLIVQVGNNIASGAYMGLIPDLVDADQRGTASGYMALMSQAGTLLGAIGAGVALEGNPVWFKYALIAAIMIGSGVVARYQIKEIPLEGEQPKLEWIPYLKSLWIDPKQYPDFAWVWITRFLVMLGFYAVLPFINYYLVDVVGIPDNQVEAKAPILLGVILFISSISGVYGGVLSDKIGRKKVVYWANALIAVVTLIFIACHNLPQALIVGGFFGLGYGAYISVDYALGTDVLPNKEEAGKDMAIWHIAMTLPQSIIAPIAGLLISLPGKTVLPPLEKGGDNIIRYTHTGYGLVFFMSACCFALGAILLKNVRGVR